MKRYFWLASTAPLLIGRLGWSPTAKSAEKSGRGPLYWMLPAIALMFLISFARWLWQMRRWLAPRPRPSPSVRKPAEEIAPEELSDWLNSVSEEDRPSPP